MDDNYLYMFGILGLLLIVTLLYYFWHKNSKVAYNQSSNNIECEGDKCFIENHE